MKKGTFCLIGAYSLRLKMRAASVSFRGSTVRCRSGIFSFFDYNAMHRYMHGPATAMGEHSSRVSRQTKALETRFGEQRALCYGQNYGMSRRKSIIGKSSLEGESDMSMADASEDFKFSEAIVLCFLASQNRSLFASKCLVETVIEMYRRGYTLDGLKIALALATLSSGEPAPPVMVDIMLTWTSVIHLTLKEIGLEKYSNISSELEEESRMSDESMRMVEGLKGIVVHWVQQFLEGMDLFRLQLQQSMQGGSDGGMETGGQSQFVNVMQQNSRLVVITLEVVRGLQLPTLKELPFPASSAREESGADVVKPPVANIGFIKGQLNSPADALAGDPLKIQDYSNDLRSAAVRLLIAFNGAALGYQRSAKYFVKTAAYSYVSGWTADEIFLALRDEEFAQSGGMMNGIKVARPPGGNNVSATLFARWLSIIYMTMAQLGIAHPKASESSGWAWVCALDSIDENESSGPLEAHGVSDFVSHTLRNRSSFRQSGSEGMYTGYSNEEGNTGATTTTATVRLIVCFQCICCISAFGFGIIIHDVFAA